MFDPIAHAAPRLVLSAVFALALAACGGASKTGTSGQVVARVDGDEISIHQLNVQLSQLPVAAADPKAVGTEVLDRLVDQQLLVKKAMEQKLDRNPDVIQKLEAAKREVLARAYGESLGGSNVPADPVAVRDFYREHPDLFSRRRIYTLAELVVRPREAQREAVMAQVKAAASVDDLAAWLKANDVPFVASGGRKPAEQLPLDLLPRFAALKDGEIAYFGGGASISVIQLQTSEEAPVSEADAANAIQQYIAARRRAELLREELQRLRASAKIEYLGEFAKPVTTDKKS